MWEILCQIKQYSVISVEWCIKQIRDQGKEIPEKRIKVTFYVQIQDKGDFARFSAAISWYSCIKSIKSPFLLIFKEKSRIQRTLCLFSEIRFGKRFVQQASFQLYLVVKQASAHNARCYWTNKIITTTKNIQGNLLIYKLLLNIKMCSNKTELNSRGKG